jgi:hypothetical protein
MPSGGGTHLEEGGRGRGRERERHGEREEHVCIAIDCTHLYIRIYMHINI